MASAVVSCRLGAQFVARSKVQHLCKQSLCARCLFTLPVSTSKRTKDPIIRTQWDGLQSQSGKNVVRIVGRLPHRTVERFQGTLSVDAVFDEITTVTDPIEVLNLTGRHRSRLTHHHIFRAFNHLWNIGKFYNGKDLEDFLLTVQQHPEFAALCVLAENKVQDTDSKLLVDTLYSALKLLPENHHPLIRELRTEICDRLTDLETDSLSKLAVCLHDMNDNRSPMCSAVLRLFSEKLHTVESSRELSAWMREVIHLVPPNDRQVIFQKASQLLASEDPKEMGDNSIRRIIQTMAKVRCVNQPLLNQCAQLLLEMVDSVQMKELCMIQSMLGYLAYENKELQNAITEAIIKKIPAARDPEEVALAMASVGRVASADIKLLLMDKAEEAIPSLTPSAIGHMSVGLRSMGFRTQIPLVQKLIKRIKEENKNLSFASISNVVGLLSRFDNVESEALTIIHERLLEILRFAFSPGRVMSTISTLSHLPNIESLDSCVPERIRAMMPQLHIAGINQVLLATCRIVRKLEKSGNLSKDFLQIKQELFERAQASIHEITSIHYLNNIVEIILQDRGHPLVLDAAMKEYSSILHRLTPQLAVDCARNLFKARYLQRDLMDEIAQVATQKINKITPMQILYILSPYCTLSYLPPNAAEFFQACVSRCEPFLDSLPAGYLVDLTHILTFVQQFPESFIRRIFSLDFLTKLDEELETIPERSMMYRRKLMYLNRTVALECPELQVPWFHEKFSQDLLKKRSLTFDSSLMSVQRCLVEVLGGPQYLRSFVVSPYYYDISFDCVLDSQGSPLACADYGSVLNRSEGKVASNMLADLMQWGTQTKQLPQGAQRVAIDYLPSTFFCINSRHTLGMVALKRRHLELMGYKYVQIPHFEWSSQALIEQEEKMEYLRQLIFSSDDVRQQAGTQESLSTAGGEMLTGQVQPKLPKNLGVKEEGLLEDEMVLKVLHNLDKIG